MTKSTANISIITHATSVLIIAYLITINTFIINEDGMLHHISRVLKVFQCKPEDKVFHTCIKTCIKTKGTFHPKTTLILTGRTCI